MSNTIITASGIIRNADKPRCGIVSQHSLESFIFDEIDQGIDLDYELMLKTLADEGKTEEQIDKAMQNYENDCRTILFGDWKKIDGQYVPSQDGKNGFSAEYSSNSGNISVEWSKTVSRCNNTSPCYVMANGDGPCGDLNNKSDNGNVLAYDLPREYYSKD